MDRLTVIEAVNDKPLGSSVSLAVGIALTSAVPVRSGVNDKSLSSSVSLAAGIALTGAVPVGSRVNEFDVAKDFDFAKGPVAANNRELANRLDPVHDGVDANDAVPFHLNDDESSLLHTPRTRETRNGSSVNPEHVPRRTDVVNELVTTIGSDAVGCPDTPNAPDAENDCESPNSLNKVTSDPPNTPDMELCPDRTKVPDVSHLLDGLKTEDLNRVPEKLSSPESAEPDSVRSPERAADPERRNRRDERNEREWGRTPETTSPERKPELPRNSEDAVTFDDGRNMAVTVDQCVPVNSPDHGCTCEKNEALEPNCFESANGALSENCAECVGASWILNCGTVRLWTIGNGDRDLLKAGRWTGVAHGVFSGWLATDSSGMKTTVFTTRWLKKTDEGSMWSGPDTSAQAVSYSGTTQMWPETKNLS
jgi:hypothetical protein